MTDTLKSSRFNLILLSIGIAVYYSAEVTIEKFSFFGLLVSTGKPIFLIILAWAAWLYGIPSLY